MFCGFLIEKVCNQGTGYNGFQEIHEDREASHSFAGGSANEPHSPLVFTDNIP